MYRIAICDDDLVFGSLLEQYLQNFAKTRRIPIDVLVFARGEEYLEFLMAHPHITVYEDGALRYEIYRISGADGDSFTLPVPNPASSYQASLDNLGGGVLAYTYN